MNRKQLAIPINNYKRGKIFYRYPLQKINNKIKLNMHHIEMIIENLYVRFCYCNHNELW